MGENFLYSLEIMGKGMSAIFVVIVAIYISVLILHKTTKEAE